MLAFPLSPVESMLASTSTYLPHSALHLAVPPMPGPSDCVTGFPSSSGWSALSFYESVPRAISSAPSTSRTRDYDEVVYSIPSVSRWEHLDAPKSEETRRSLTPFGPRRAPSPFPGRGNGGMDFVSTEFQRGAASARPSSAPQFLRHSVAASAPDVSSAGASQRVKKTGPTGSSYNAPDVSRGRHADPEPTEDELDFERKLVSLPSLRKKVRTHRGPHARSAADIQKLVPPFGSPRCQHAECTDAKCATCVYLRRRGDGPLRTRLLKRDKDRDLWHLRPAAYDEPWAYAEDRGKLTALQASYVLGRERALRGSRARL
ncbi:hypothetical protein BD309DRAFT_976794 [Dichomitus squalens]|nr:hypothetical protein BD309DRAFT_976794 [Dichomitus squalens]